jgi:cytochrome P450
LTTDSAQGQVARVRLGDAFGNNPYPVYLALREAGPVHPIIQPDGTQAWIVTRFADVRACLADLRLSSRVNLAQQEPVVVGDDMQQAIGQMVLRRDEVYQSVMLNQDPPAHTRLRQLVVGALAAKRVDALRPTMTAIAQRLLDALAQRCDADPGSPIDLVETYAKPLPVAVNCELLGIRPADREAFSSQVDKVIDGADPEAGQAALEALKGFIAAEIEYKRTHRAADLLTGLIVAAEEEGRMSVNELVSTALQVMNAGYFGTHGLIGNGTYWLLRNPGKLAELVADPSLVPAAVEELLRFDGPMVPGAFRYATEDIEVGGTTIPKGALVVLSITAANRDPEQFPDPDTIDIHRHGQHLAYGHGIHYCVGARLASSMVSIAIGELIARFPGMRLAIPPERMHWRLRSPLRSCDELPVLLRP